eukprot:1590156-Pyramimonas_sp.AAC.1
MGIERMGKTPRANLGSGLAKGEGDGSLWVQDAPSTGPEPPCGMFVETRKRRRAGASMGASGTARKAL